MEINNELLYLDYGGLQRYHELILNQLEEKVDNDDSRLSDSRTPTSHTHGNIQNGGNLLTEDITIASGDKIVVTDSSDSGKVARTSISFDGSTVNKALTPKGTWETFATSDTTYTFELNNNSLLIDGNTVFTPTVTSVAGKTGVISLDKSDVGLNNVTNDAQVKRTEMGVANGVATLDSNGLVPSSLLPSYVDDIVELIAISETNPSTSLIGDLYYNSISKKLVKSTAANTWGTDLINPESGKIYVDLSINKSYRWGGSDMVEIPSSLAIGIISGTAADGGTVNSHINNTNNPHSVTKDQVGLGNVTNDALIKGLASGTTSGHIVTFGNDGYTVLDSGKTIATSVPENALFTDTKYKFTIGSTVNGDSEGTSLGTLENKSASTNGTDLSLVTTGEKDIWNNKLEALAFNTTYNATTNKVATMSDIPSVFDSTNDGLAPAASNSNKTTAETSLSNYYLCADGKYRLLPQEAFLSGNLDYTTEEEEIISVPDSLAASALRKTAQTLTSLEKALVWENLGITAQVLSDWNLSDNTLKDFIKNKPTIPSSSDIQAKITASGLLKGDGSGTISAAVASTDYVAPVSGKDLSTNDFTNALKTKVDNIQNLTVSNTTSGSLALTTNTFYSLGTLTGALTVTLESPVSNITNEYNIEFDVTNTSNVPSFPASVVWQEEITWEADKHYEISIKYDANSTVYYGLVVAWDIPSAS